VRSIHIPTVSAYLQALLLTGRRREELALLKWDDVSFEWQSMRLRDKVEGSSVLPLTPYIGSLLLALPRRNEWVFSSDAQNSTTGRIADVRYPHVKALEMAGLPHVSLHGLRRSFSSLAEWSEVPSGAIAQLQGHQPSALAEKHYKRRPLDMLRMFHTRIEAWFLEQAGIPQPSAIQEGLRLVKAA
jgi:integrase